jgi:CheY-like chemotaxis protein
LGETIYLQKQLAENLPPVLVDRNQLETSLLNLALNARDSMPRGGRLTIRTELYRKLASSTSFTDLPAGEYLMLSVRDEGEGMSAETINRAFEPFYTTKPAGVGTGLGLSMVYGFVKQSGGGIDIRSKLGEGTTLRVIFPVVDQTPTQEQNNLLRLKQQGQQAKVLLVEDDVGVRQFVQRALHKMGYTVDLAENGDFAWEKFSHNPDYELVLTDIIMPGSISGLELYSRIRHDYPQTKVLCMTGYSEQVESTLSEQHLLRKPFMRNQLAHKLQELLKTEHA